ncbi:Ankyrin repeat domain-containing protein 50 [Batrachochytrium dendrobatidis]|nr:Ankyrin repeat domain-containing protein 50 [Batrachochytrium dendrobatidis]
MVSQPTSPIPSDTQSPQQTSLLSAQKQNSTTPRTKGSTAEPTPVTTKSNGTPSTQASPTRRSLFNINKAVRKSHQELSGSSSSNSNIAEPVQKPVGIGMESGKLNAPLYSSSPDLFSSSNTARDFATMPVEVLLKHSEIDLNKFTSLQKAVFHGDIKTVAEKMPKKPVADRNDALLLAAELGVVHAVLLLLGLKNPMGVRADSNATDKKGRTPLILAASHGHANIIKDILEAGGNIDHRDLLGCTALHYSVASNSISCLQILLANGADMDFIDRSGDSLLHHAIRFQRHDIAQELLQKGHSPTISNTIKITPLHLAAMFGMKHIVMLLLENGADPTALDNKGQAPADYAKPPNEDIAKLLHDQVDRQLLQVAQRAQKTFKPSMTVSNTNTKTESTTSSISIRLSDLPVVLEDLNDSVYDIDLPRVSHKVQGIITRKVQLETKSESSMISDDLQSAASKQDANSEPSLKHVADSLKPCASIDIPSLSMSFGSSNSSEPIDIEFDDDIIDLPSKSNSPAFKKSQLDDENLPIAIQPSFISENNDSKLVDYKNKSTKESPFCKSDNAVSYFPLNRVALPAQSPKRQVLSLNASSTTTSELNQQQSNDTIKTKNRASSVAGSTNTFIIDPLVDTKGLASSNIDTDTMLPDFEKSNNTRISVLAQEKDVLKPLDTCEAENVMKHDTATYRLIDTAAISQQLKLLRLEFGENLDKIELINQFEELVTHAKELQVEQHAGSDQQKTISTYSPLIELSNNQACINSCTDSDQTKSIEQLKQNIHEQGQELDQVRWELSRSKEREAILEQTNNHNVDIIAKRESHIQILLQQLKPVTSIDGLTIIESHDKSDPKLNSEFAKLAINPDVIKYYENEVKLLSRQIEEEQQLRNVQMKEQHSLLNCMAELEKRLAEFETNEPRMETSVSDIEIKANSTSSISTVEFEKLQMQLDEANAQCQRYKQDIESCEQNMLALDDELIIQENNYKSMVEKHNKHTVECSTEISQLKKALEKYDLCEINRVQDATKYMEMEKQVETLLAALGSSKQTIESLENNLAEKNKQLKETHDLFSDKQKQFSDHIFKEQELQSVLNFNEKSFTATPTKSLNAAQGKTRAFSTTSILSTASTPFGIYAKETSQRTIKNEPLESQKERDTLSTRVSKNNVFESDSLHKYQQTIGRQTRHIEETLKSILEDSFTFLENHLVDDARLKDVKNLRHFDDTLNNSISDFNMNRLVQIDEILFVLTKLHTHIMELHKSTKAAFQEKHDFVSEKVCILEEKMARLESELKVAETQKMSAQESFQILSDSSESEIRILKRHIKILEQEHHNQELELFKEKAVKTRQRSEMETEATIHQEIESSEQASSIKTGQKFKELALCDQLNNTIDKFQAQIENEAAAHQAEVLTLQSQISSLEQKLNSSVNTIAAMNVAHSKQENSSTIQLEQIQQKLLQHISSAHEYQRKIKALESCRAEWETDRSELVDKQSQITSLKKQLTTLQSTATLDCVKKDAALNLIKTQLESLKRDAETSQNVIDGLQAQLRDKEQQLGSQTQISDQLKIEHTTLNQQLITSKALVESTEVRARSIQEITISTIDMLESITFAMSEVMSTWTTNLNQRHLPKNILLNKNDTSLDNINTTINCGRTVIGKGMMDITNQIGDLVSDCNANMSSLSILLAETAKSELRTEPQLLDPLRKLLGTQRETFAGSIQVFCSIDRYQQSLFHLVQLQSESVRELIHDSMTKQQDQRDKIVVDLERKIEALKKQNAILVKPVTSMTLEPSPSTSRPDTNIDSSFLSSTRPKSPSKLSKPYVDDVHDSTFETSCELEQQKTEMLKLQTAVSEYETTIALQKKTVLNLQDLNKKSEQRILILDNDNSAAAKHIDELNHDIESLTTIISTNKTTIQKLESRIDTLCKENSDVQEYRKLYRDADAKIVELKSRIKELEVAQLRFNNDCNEALNVQIQKPGQLPQESESKRQISKQSQDYPDQTAFDSAQRFNQAKCINTEILVEAAGLVCNSKAYTIQEGLKWTEMELDKQTESTSLLGKKHHNDMQGAINQLEDTRNVRSSATDKLKEGYCRLEKELQLQSLEMASLQKQLSGLKQQLQTKEALMPQLDQKVAFPNSKQTQNSSIEINMQSQMEHVTLERDRYQKESLKLAQCNSRLTSKIMELEIELENAKSNAMSKLAFTMHGSPATKLFAVPSVEFDRKENCSPLCLDNQNEPTSLQVRMIEQQLREEQSKRLVNESAARHLIKEYEEALEQLRDEHSKISLAYAAKRSACRQVEQALEKSHDREIQEAKRAVRLEQAMNKLRANHKTAQQKYVAEEEKLKKQFQKQVANVIKSYDARSEERSELEKYRSRNEEAIHRAYEKQIQTLLDEVQCLRQELVNISKQNR